MKRMFTMYRNADAGNNSGGDAFQALMSGLTPEQQAVVTDRLSKTNAEAKGLRDRLKAHEDLHGKIKSKFGVESIDDTFLESLKINASKAGEKETELTELRKQMAGLRANFDNMTKAQQQAKLNEAITASLGKIGVRPDAIVNATKLISLNGNLNEAGEWEFDGMPLDKFIVEWSKQNQYMIGNPVKPGNGNSGESNNGHEAVKDFLSAEEYLAMPREKQLSPEIAKRANASMHLWK